MVSQEQSDASRYRDRLVNDVVDRLERLVSDGSLTAETFVHQLAEIYRDPTFEVPIKRCPTELWDKRLIKGLETCHLLNKYHSVSRGILGKQYSDMFDDLRVQTYSYCDYMAKYLFEPSADISILKSLVSTDEFAKHIPPKKDATALTQQEEERVNTQQKEARKCMRKLEEAFDSQRFHVFLSHNSKDKPAVKRLGLELKKRGLNPWLDEWELQPGLEWQDALEDIIKTCGSVAICLAENGIGPWEDPEMKALLRRFIEEKKNDKIVPVIPVLLPGAPVDVRLPLFLEAFTWVDLRSGLTKECIDRLIWGITGTKPTS